MLITNPYTTVLQSASLIQDLATALHEHRIVSCRLEEELQQLQIQGSKLEKQHGKVQGQPDRAAQAAMLTGLQSLLTLKISAFQEMPRPEITYQGSPHPGRGTSVRSVPQSQMTSNTNVMTL